MLRVALLILCGAITACAPPKEMGWIRADAKPVDPAQFEVSTTICRGDAQKAGLAARRVEGIGEAYRQGQAQGDVFVGCMAQQGYLRREVP